MKLNLKTTRARLTNSRPGFVLLVTIIVLAVLASLVAGLSVHLSMAKRRQQYRIEYQRSRYGVDSGIKYIMTRLPTEKFKLADRKAQPDFSDMFLMNHAEFAEFIANWSETATDEEIEAVLKDGASLSAPMPLSPGAMASQLASLFGGGQSTDMNDMGTDSYDSDEQLYMVELDPNDVVVPGPYGPVWPYVMEPIDLDIGSCKVTISIEDENAKMPLSWFVTSSKEANERAENALKTFCEWMSWDQEQLLELESAIQDATEKIQEKKTFNLNSKPILLKSVVKRTVKTPARSTTSRSRRITTRSSRTRTVRHTQVKERPAVAHTTDFAKLFHSSMVDRELLARPLPDTGERVESPLKYLSLWGAQRVNVNTAPRHVLEATFSLAVDSFDLPEITQKVIEQRQEKPLKDIDELKSLCGFDTDTMKQLQNYLTTTSTFFQVRVDSQSGSAHASAVATVVKEGKNFQQLFILYE